jgi:hypothetical protein
MKILIRDSTLNYLKFQGKSLLRKRGVVYADRISPEDVYKAASTSNIIWQKLALTYALHPTKFSTYYMELDISLSFFLIFDFRPMDGNLNRAERKIG